MAYLDSPEFKRKYNSVSDSGIKLLANIFTTAFTGIVNGIKAVVMQILGK